MKATAADLAVCQLLAPGTEVLVVDDHGTWTGHVFTIDPYPAEATVRVVAPNGNPHRTEGERVICTVRQLRLARPVLTERQMQVLQLTADGLSHREMAKALNLSMSTVNSHSALMTHNLRAAHATHPSCLAVAVAYRIGLLGQPEVTK